MGAVNKTQDSKTQGQGNESKQRVNRLHETRQDNNQTRFQQFRDTSDFANNQMTASVEHLIPVIYCTPFYNFRMNFAGN
jgi:hypothetical protein